MATKIIHKKSSVSGSVPTASDLEAGELAVNLADRIIYSKTTGGTVIEMGVTDASSILETAKNVSGGTLTAGTPVYQSGTSGNAIEVQQADADTSSMPAIGILAEDIADQAEGDIVLLGFLQGIDTSSFSAGDTLYVSATGTLANTPPTGESAKIQNIGKVIKVHATNGSILVTGAGRSNATPNLNDGKFFLGNSSNQAVTATFDTEVANTPSVSANTSKLSGIEANADVTDTANVSAAGALMKTGGTMTGNLILNADPTVALGAATKEYVDTIAAAGVHYHTPVRVEKEGNLSATYNNGTNGVGATLTNNSTQAALVIDDVTLSTNDRVLIYEQTDATQNGIYVVTNTGSASTNWVLTRADDADTYSPSDPDNFGQGDAFFVQEGTHGAGELYVMNTAGTITFGTTEIHFTQVAKTAVYSSGTGVTLTGTQISIGQDVGTTASPTFANISVTGNVDGRDVSVDGAKLDNIEANADVTDTANVTAAGAVMDSELTSEAAVKAINQQLTTTSSPTFASVNINGTTTTDGVTSDGVIKNVANTVTASGATTTIDMTASNFHVITMQADTTFSFSNLASAITSSGTLVIKQDATGGRDFTLPSSCKTPVGGATIVQETGANTTSILSYIVVSSTEVLVNYVGNFA